MRMCSYPLCAKDKQTGSASEGGRSQGVTGLYEAVLGQQNLTESGQVLA